ncbi:MAG: hypothetical protein ACSLE0_24050, partial [Chitinophagaceae bacterium]
MNIFRLLFIFSFLIISIGTYSQDDGYKTPPNDITNMLLAKPTPTVSIDGSGEWMLLTETNSYPSVAELAKPELRIAGLRINPNNYSPSRQNFINNIYLKNISNKNEYKITGLPSPLFAANIKWSPVQKKIAFTHSTSNRVDLYVIDIATQKATRINKTALNVLGGDYLWYDDNTVLYRSTLKPAGAAPQKPAAPKGPSIQENAGKASPRPTYQDMIKTPFDEQLVEFYLTSQLVKNTKGMETKIGKPSMYTLIDPSPDKKYILIRTLQKPFSYLVPYSG